MYQAHRDCPRPCGCKDHEDLAPILKQLMGQKRRQVVGQVGARCQWCDTRVYVEGVRHSALG